jgi:hypothetical protein
MEQSAAFAISLVPAQREDAMLKGRSSHRTAIAWQKEQETWRK